MHPLILFLFATLFSGGSASVPVGRRYLKQGDYHDWSSSCTDARMLGSYLIANCQHGGNQYRWTKLDINTFIGFDVEVHNLIWSTSGGYANYCDPDLCKLGGFEGPADYICPCDRQGEAVLHAEQNLDNHIGNIDGTLCAYQSQLGILERCGEPL